MKINNVFFVVLMVIFDILPGYSQAPDWTRMLQIWTYGLQAGNALDVDADNVYMAGSVSGPVTFNNIDCTSTGNRDMILSKYTADGLHTWTRQFNAQAGGSITPHALKVDASQNIVVSGAFEGSLTIGSHTVTSGASANAFIARFDANGNGLWVSAFVSTGTGLSRLAMDAAGDYYINDRSNKLLKFSANGEMQWEQVYADGTLQAIAVSGSNLFIGGSIKGNTSFGDITLSPSSTYKTGFLLRADLNGIYNLSLLGGGKNSNHGSVIGDIIFDASGNLIITGGYSRELFLNNTQLPANSNGSCTFIAQCNSDFSFSWARASSAIAIFPDRNWTFRLYKDHMNNLYEYGMMLQPFTFGSVSIEPRSGQFIVKFDENGNAIKGHTTTNTSYNTLMVSPKGKIIKTGSYNYDNAPSFGNLYLEQYDNDMNLEWKKETTASKSGIAAVNNVKHDKEGNTYLQSRIRGYCDYFGTAIQTNNPVTVISKHDISGNLLWINQIEDINLHLYGSTFTLDKDNNVLTTGSFSTSLTIGPATLTSIYGGKKAYVAKYNSNGEFQWASKLNDHEYYHLNLTTDTDGNVVVSGVQSPANYVMKYNSSGQKLWEKTFPMESHYWALVSTDASNNIYLASEVHLSNPGIPGSAILGSVTLTQTTEDGATSLLKLDPNGNPLWAKTFGGVKGATFSDGWPKGIKTDATGNSYIWGIGENNSIFGTTTLTNPFKTTNLYLHYLTKVNASGEVLWAKAIHEKAFSFNYGDLLDLDKDGNAYIGASFKDSISISGTLCRPEGLNDFLVVKYSKDGDPQWIKTVASNNNPINALSVLDNDKLTIVSTAGKNPALDAFPYTKKGNSTCMVATLGNLSTGTNSIPANLEEDHISLYPNPNNGKFRLEIQNLKTSNENTELQILNMMGKSIYSTPYIKIQESNEIDLSGIPKGIYFLQLYTGSKTYIKKMVVN